jgi:hypothetical protein
VENGRRKQKGRTLRVRPFSKTQAEVRDSAASSDMAHPLIVAGATAEHFGALMGPGVDHGARPYSRTGWLVKPTFRKRSFDVCLAGGKHAPDFGPGSSVSP